MQTSNKFAVYWNTVEWLRYCYKIVFIICAEDLGQWGFSRFPRKHKLSPNNHREIQGGPAGLRETQIPAKHRDFLRVGMHELAWNCLV